MAFLVQPDGLPIQPSETVNHPSHYGGDTPYEVIKVIEAWGLDRNFCLANVVKYVARYDKKGDPVENLKKARFYLDYEIQKLENVKGESNCRELILETRAAMC